MNIVLLLFYDRDNEMKMVEVGLSHELYQASENMYLHLDLPRLVAETLSTTSLPQQRQLLSNIVLTGGNTRLAGFGNRLAHDLRAALPKSLAPCVRVVDPRLMTGRSDAVIGAAYVRKWRDARWITRHDFILNGLESCIATESETSSLSDDDLSVSEKMDTDNVDSVQSDGLAGGDIACDGLAVIDTVADSQATAVLEKVNIDNLTAAVKTASLDTDAIVSGDNVTRSLEREISHSVESATFCGIVSDDTGSQLVDNVRSVRKRESPTTESRAVISAASGSTITGLDDDITMDVSSAILDVVKLSNMTLSGTASDREIDV
jgi:hypothetical protein